MAVEALKSTAITNLDATPVVQNTAGEGGISRIFHVNGFQTASASASTGSTYRLVRIPTSAKVKQIVFESAAQGAGKFDLSVYYSDSTVDGSPVAQAGAVVASTGSQFFASIIDCASAVARTDVTNESGNYTVDKRNKALWDALGLSSDPGGWFDIVAVCATTAVTTGTGKFGVDVWFTN